MKSIKKTKPCISDEVRKVVVLGQSVHTVIGGSTSVDQTCDRLLPPSSPDLCSSSSVAMTCVLGWAPCGTNGSLIGWDLTFYISCNCWWGCLLKKNGLKGPTLMCASANILCDKVSVQSSAKKKSGLFKWELTVTEYFSLVTSYMLWSQMRSITAFQVFNVKFSLLFFASSPQVKNMKTLFCC